MKHYNLKRIESYNRLINMIVGARGIGKTYALKERCIRQFKTNGYKFIYLRRFEEEIKAVKDKLFDDVLHLLDDDESIEISGRDILLVKTIPQEKGKPKKETRKMGEFLWLAKSQAIKSASYKDYRTCVFDEFLIEDNAHHYFSGEVENNFLSIVSTVVRNATNPADCCKFFLLANSTTKYNPYFDYFKVCNLKPGKSFYTGFNKQLVLEYNQNRVFVKQMEGTLVGTLIKGTDAEDYMINNNFYADDDTSFILSKPGCQLQYLCTIKIGSEVYGFYTNWDVVWVSKSVDPNHPQKYALTIGDVCEGYTLISFFPARKTLQYLYQTGCVYYQNVKTRNTVRSALQYL